MRKDYFEFIESWYDNKCDGSWEHAYGIDISTLDNPGWQVKVTGENGKNFFKENREGDDDWYRVNANDKEFLGYGGSKNLGDLLRLLENWIKN